MFAQTYQSGFISLLYSVGPRPLQLCEKHEETPGSVRRVLDEDVQSSVVELSADNLVHTWLRFPPEANEQQQQDQSALHIRLRHLVLVLKNLEQHVSLEVQVADDRGTRRRLRFSTFQKKSAVHPEIALLPLQLDSGWNQVQLDLVELMHTCYNARAATAEFRLYKRLTKEQAQQYREEDRRLQQIQK
ncbi:hypothetical protein PRIC1_014868 [Phytophthora ramorum]